MLLNCGAGEDSWESLGLQGDQTSPEYSLEGLMLKLKPQYFGHLVRRTDSVGKSLMLGKMEGRRRRGRQRIRWLDSIINSMGMNLSKLRETVKDREAWHAAVLGVTKSWTRLVLEQQSNKSTCFLLPNVKRNSQYWAVLAREILWWKNKLLRNLSSYM